MDRKNYKGDKNKKWYFKYGVLWAIQGFLILLSHGSMDPTVFGSKDPSCSFRG